METDAALKGQWALYRETLAQAVALEHLAEQWRMESEAAAVAVPDLKQQGREQVAGRRDRMLPIQRRGVDEYTNSFKVMLDAKGDHLLYMQRAQMYACLAQMKFAKAMAIRPQRPEPQAP